MPIAAICCGLNFFIAFNFMIACIVCCHHMSGDCSAQPDCKEVMPVSVSGNCVEAMHCWVAASTTDILIEEVSDIYSE